MSDFIQIECPMSLFNDAELLGLGAACDAWHDAGAKAIAAQVGAMCLHESNRRERNRKTDGDPIPPGLFSLKAADWSDSDVADSLIFCWGMSTDSRDAKVGELMDALGNVFVTMAAQRLRGLSSDDA